ncbi:MAG: hypothetical protein AAB789_01970 [Patescibacteria group bacterium]
MSTIKKTELIKEVIDVAGLGSMDKKPSRLLDFITPVIDINPNHNRILNVIKSTKLATSGQAVVYTTPTNQDFYLVTASLQSTDDVTSDNTETILAVKVGGTTELPILIHKKPSVTLFREFSGIYLGPIGMKLDRGTTITLDNSFTVGASTKAVVITGYIVNNY